MKVNCQFDFMNSDRFQPNVVVVVVVVVVSLELGCSVHSNCDHPLVDTVGVKCIMLH